MNLFLARHKPDILLIAEHKLSPRHRLDFGGYVTFRQNRHNGRGGGTAVVVREGISCGRIILDTGGIENTAVCIRRVDGSTVTVVSMYFRPGDTLSVSFLDPLTALSARGDVVVGADFNAKHPDWGGTVVNPSGRCLRDFILSCPDMDIFPTEGPTRISRNSSSYIDVFLVSSGIRVNSGALHGLKTLDYESDHRAVEVVLGMEGLERAERSILYDFSRMDRRCFNRVLTRDLSHCGLPLDRNASVREIDDCIAGMSSAFHGAMGSSIPRVRSGNRGLLKLPSNILHFIAEKKRLRRTLRRTGDPGREAFLRADIRNLDKIIQGAIAVFEESYWTDYLRAVRLGDRTFRQVKRAAGLSRRAPVAELVDVRGSFVVDDPGKADLLADRFLEVHSGNEGLRMSSFEGAVRGEVSALEDRTPLVDFGEGVMADGAVINVDINLRTLGFVKPSEIGEALRRRANKRSSGRDGVPDIVLRRTDLAAWRFLAVLFNHCVNIGYFPTAWKEALVVPILKPGSDPGQSGSYRPISLLSAFGKLFEYFVLSRIRDRISDGGILADCQFGFRGGHSTSHALTVFSDYVAKGLNKRYATIAVSLDFAKAFDTAWQDGIVYKMVTMGFERNTCRIVADFLRGRTFRVKVGEAISNERMVSAGVPQGSLLGPVLYNIFVSDIPQPPVGDLLLIYADDMLIASSGPRARTCNARLNSYLSELSTYFRKWGLRLNVSKSEGVMIKGRRKYLFRNSRSYIPVLNVGGEFIRVSDRIKYLGVIFHENFEFYRHLDHILTKVKKVFFAYQRLLRRRGGLSIRVKLLVYKQIIRPLISYAFPVWFGISSSQMERLRIWERRILAACLGLRPRLIADGVYRRPSCKSIYDGVDFGRVDVFLIESALSFIERAASHENRLIRECFEHDGGLLPMQDRRYLSPVDLRTLEGEGLLYRGADLLFYHRRIHSFDLGDLVYNTKQ